MPSETVKVSNTVTVDATDAMQFSTKRIEVNGGEPVTLTLNHTGTMSKDIMGHNWVLLKQGTDLEAFALDGAGAKDSNYIAAAKAESVIAATELIGGGESSTITFDAPEPGIYWFLCTFPGHYAVMKGEFVVRG